MGLGDTAILELDTAIVELDKPYTQPVHGLFGLVCGCQAFVFDTHSVAITNPW